MIFRLNIAIEAPRWEDIETFRNPENLVPVRLEAVRCGNWSRDKNCICFFSENCGQTRGFKAATPGGQNFPPSTQSTSRLNSKIETSCLHTSQSERFLFSFLDQIERISESGYLPITEDIIRVRRGTRGIPGWFRPTDFYFSSLMTQFSIPVPYEFFVSGIKFKITDVGGDREQRQNWIDVMGVGSTVYDLQIIFFQ